MTAYVIADADNCNDTSRFVVLVPMRVGYHRALGHPLLEALQRRWTDLERATRFATPGDAMIELCELQRLHHEVVEVDT